MIQISDLINDIHKDVELERQGMRRTRRWTGITSPVTDNPSYQARAYRFLKTKPNLDEISQMAETQPRRATLNPILTYFRNLLTTRRNPVSGKS
jgi:hypothetical protein